MLEYAYNYDHVTPTSFTDQTESLLIYGWYNGNYSLGVVLDRWFGISTEPPETFTEDSMNIYWEHEDNTEELPYYAGDWPAFRWYLGAYQADIRRMIGSSITKNVYFYTKVLHRNRDNLVESYAYFYCVLNASIADRSTEPEIIAPSYEVIDETQLIVSEVGTIFKGITDVDVTFNAKAHTGREIVSYEIRNGNTIKKGNFSSPSNEITFTQRIIDCESPTFYITVTDNYGYSDNSFIQASYFINYYPPTCNISSQRASATGGATAIVLDGTAFTETIGTDIGGVATYLTLDAYYRYKLNTEDAQWSAWESMTLTKGKNIFTATANLIGLDYKSTYIVEGRITDNFNSVISSQIEVYTQPMFDWSESDFNFNVPVAIQGDLTVNGIVNMNEETVLRHTGSITNNTVLSGSGGHIYLRPHGTSTITGEVRITPNGDIYPSGTIYAPNVVVDGVKLSTVIEKLQSIGILPEPTT